MCSRYYHPLSSFPPPNTMQTYQNLYFGFTADKMRIIFNFHVRQKEITYYLYVGTYYTTVHEEIFIYKYS